MPFPRIPMRLPHSNYIGTRRYYITFCCFERRKIFLDNECSSLFLSVLAKQSNQHNFAILAYCLIPDHIHLLAHGLKTSSDLQVFMTALKQHSGFYLKRRFVAPIWQRFFNDRIFRPSERSDAVACYIWMNPVRANLCEDVRDYRNSGSFSGLWPPHQVPTAVWSPPNSR